MHKRPEKGAGRRQQMTSKPTFKFLAWGAAWVVVSIAEIRRCQGKKSELGAER